MEQVIVNGLYLGAQYALIALGLTLIFALMNVLNFAHGQMYVLGAFLTCCFFLRAVALAVRNEGLAHTVVKLMIAYGVLKSRTPFDPSKGVKLVT